MNKYQNLSEPQAELDFHQFEILTKDEIIEITDQFIKKSHKHKFNKILIITGKGLHSRNGTAVIKPIINDYLNSHPLVKRFATARIDRGAEGAFEITLIS
ncbi:hypothetical protein COV81_01765 [Candidatus Peregrinibacteria bacterium CG11_big_fil_rev_8_21_14_0_20_41_10]|nr:MAG: hypothetical protein COV81_01765 [Candidatus Peregrinibacteria bacterium CG11_big_fil_rev_8_21_14_0_20_41_10]